MKKIYAFAVAAATVCMMASCGGNKGGNAEAQGTEAQEEVVEGAETPLADELLTEPKTFDAAAFSITAPAGWLVEGNDGRPVRSLRDW